MYREHSTIHRPNILYIHSHDTGRYVQPYGHAVPAPHLQLLAEQGVLFRQAFAAAPTCSPSRASLLTGQLPHNNGMVGLAHRGFALYDEKHHILHTLREAGYYSALVGEEHVAREHESIGYDYVASLDSFEAEKVAPATADLLLHCKLPEPFFLSVGFFETHREYPQPASPTDANYSLPPAPLPDTPETRRDMAAFKAAVWNLDQGIGTVLNALEDSGLAETTLVVCTTDHGIAFPHMKGSLTDHGIGVMLIMRGPGGFSGGKVYDTLVSQIDLFPTICDLLDIDSPDWLQGTSLLPLVNGEKKQVHDAIFAEVTYHAAYEPQRAIRTPRWKYIRRFDQYPGPVLPNCDDSASKDLLIHYNWRGRTKQGEELHDLIFDPNEACNIADDPSAAQTLEEMRRRLDDWMRCTNDPLLRGSVAAPSGSELNDPDQFSPGDPTHFV